MTEPSPLDWELLFDRLLQTRLQIALAVTGGGSRCISRCFARSGASSNFVEAIVPYSRSALQSYLRQELLGPYVAESVALAMAQEARRRAESCSDQKEGPFAGIGLTAALPTQSQSVVQPRVYVAAVRDAELQQWGATLPASLTRDASEDVAESMLRRALTWVIQ